jgi:hypothetical protein
VHYWHLLCYWHLLYYWHLRYWHLLYYWHLLCPFRGSRVTVVRWLATEMRVLAGICWQVTDSWLTILWNAGSGNLDKYRKFFLEIFTAGVLQDPLFLQGLHSTDWVCYGRSPSRSTVLTRALRHSLGILFGYRHFLQRW